MKENAYVYFMTNSDNGVLYIGVTTNLERRAWEHKNHIHSFAFTSKYQCNRLVYYEHTSSVTGAIAREKQLKNWKREWKNELVEQQNPTWDDLSEGWAGWKER